VFGGSGCLLLDPGASAGPPGEAAVRLPQASLRTDDGKIGVPDAILLKAGLITPCKGHAEASRDRSPAHREDPVPARAVPIGDHQHEGWDGTGSRPGFRPAADVTTSEVVTPVSSARPSAYRHGLGPAQRAGRGPLARRTRHVEARTLKVPLIPTSRTAARGAFLFAFRRRSMPRSCSPFRSNAAGGMVPRALRLDPNRGIRPYTHPWREGVWSG